MSNKTKQVYTLVYQQWTVKKSINPNKHFTQINSYHIINMEMYNNLLPTQNLDPQVVFVQHRKIATNNIIHC